MVFPDVDISFFTGEYYYTAITLSFILSLLAISLVYKYTQDELTFFLLITICLSQRHLWTIPLQDWKILYLTCSL